MARIAIATAAHHCNNPRVVKEADALAAAGHEVTVVGPILRAELKEVDARMRAGARWRYRPTYDLTKRGAARLFRRVRRRVAKELIHRLDVETHWALGYGLGDLRAAVRDEDPDLVIGHEEAGLWVAEKVLRSGRRASVDIEDWYSRDLLPSARAERPIRKLEALEAACVKGCASVTATSRTMAEELGKAYGRDDIAVVYNAFPAWDPPATEVSPGRAQGPPSLVWFSQTVGRGRGLDRVFRALPLLDRPVTLTLIGDCADRMRASLESEFPRDRGHGLEFQPRVPPWELAAHLARHDAGLALEESEPDNKDTTIANKLFQCIASGIPVIATPTRGHREAAALSPAVRVARSREPADMAETIRGLLGTGEALREGRRQAREAARGALSWERSERVLVEAVEKALAAPGAR